MGRKTNGLTARQIREHERFNAARAQANQDPTPGPLKQAFEVELLKVGCLTLQPLVGSHILILKRLNSPIYRHVIEAAKPETQRVKIDYDDEEIFEALFVLTQHPQKVRAALAQGRQAFREEALAATADVLGVFDMGRATEMIGEAFRRAFATQTEVTAATDAEGGGENFQAPPASP